MFWYIRKGDLNRGMPSRASLPGQQRWQVVSSYVNLPRSAGVSAASSEGAAALGSDANVPPPPAPFTDYRFEKPCRTRKIMLADPHAAFGTCCAEHHPEVLDRDSSPG